MTENGSGLTLGWSGTPQFRSNYPQIHHCSVLEDSQLGKSPVNGANGGTHVEKKNRKKIIMEAMEADPVVSFPSSTLSQAAVPD